MILLTLPPSSSSVTGPESLDSSAGAITGLLGHGTEHTSYGPQGSPW